MNDSIFCPNCGMLKVNCICDNKHEYSKKDKSAKNNLFSYSNLEEEKYNAPSTYSIEDNSLSDEKISKIKKDYPHIDDEIIEMFPFENPRTGQLEIIQDINDAIKNGYKYIILEAGTGTGKSVIAATLARLYESAYILTMTKQLQDQYANEFNFSVVKGRKNFSCLQDDLDSTCDIGVCKTSPPSSKFTCNYGIAKNPSLLSNIAFEDSFGVPIYYQSGDICHYWEQKANSINSPISLMNYDYAILELNYVKHFPSRSLLILDEAHNIEDKLMKIMEVKLTNTQLEKDLKKVLSPKSLKENELKDWILEIGAIKDSYNELDMSNFNKNQEDRINSTIFKLNQLIENLEKEPKNWAINTDNYSVSFKPLKVNKYAKNYLFKHGDVCIFLSATILSHKMFSKWLGLNPDEVYHIKADSPFSPDNRPIELRLAGKMSKNVIKDTAPKSIPILKDILKKHKDDKGLIHTHSYKCQRFLINNLFTPRLITHNRINRAEVLNDFEDSDNPLVLASPSMSEGVDLPYDKCRFQVIYKIPFPYLGDNQVFLRQKQDKRWYAYKTIMTLMQAYGRGMRAEDDYCHTYILDSDINMILSRPLYRNLIPEFFKEAITSGKVKTF